MTIAYLGLGSNQGDRAAHLQQAVSRLGAASGVAVMACSRVYETDPVGPEQADYLNAVVVVETTRAPADLLALGQRLEIEAGREPDPARRERWGPRPLDVDVLLLGPAGEIAVHDDDLVVPHPRIAERPFVLAPLADVAPGLPVVVEGRSRFPGWPGVRAVDVELRT